MIRHPVCMSPVSYLEDIIDYRRNYGEVRQISEWFYLME
jgi:hypothetical protein